MFEISDVMTKREGQPKRFSIKSMLLEIVIYVVLIAIFILMLKLTVKQ